MVGYILLALAGIGVGVLSTVLWQRWRLRSANAANIVRLARRDADAAAQGAFADVADADEAARAAADAAVRDSDFAKYLRSLSGTSREPTAED